MIKSVPEFLTSTLTIVILLENWIPTTIGMIYNICILEQLKVNFLDAL